MQAARAIRANPIESDRLAGWKPALPAEEIRVYGSQWDIMGVKIFMKISRMIQPIRCASAYAKATARQDDAPGGEDEEEELSATCLRVVS